MSKSHRHTTVTALLLGTLINLSHADLIAYWPFDEGEGSVAGDIIGGFDGAISGGTWISPGKVGSGAIEGSGGNEINCGIAPSPATEDLTLAWWMIDNQASWGTIMDKSVTGSGYGYNILVRPRSEDSPLRFRIGGWQSYGGWGNECRVPADAYNEGEWVHVVCTYDSASDTASIYINGQLPANGTFNPKTGIAGPGGYCDGVNNVDTPLFIRGGEETFNGVLDEVAIWDHALTADEVMTVYTLGPLGLQAGQRFDITEIDYSAAENEVTLTWDSREGETYAVKYSTDLVDWEADLDDGVDADPGDSTTRSFGIAEIDEDGEIFFRVEKQ